MENGEFRVLTREEYEKIPWRSSSKVGELFAPPVDVSSALGTPTIREPSSDGKTDREWVIIDPNGELFRVYAYKATAEYERGLPRPEAFWSIEGGWPLSIGGNTNPIYVHEWITERILETRDLDA